MEFRHAGRNPKQVLSEVQCEEILSKATHGVLCLSDEDGFPYGVPVSYTYDNRRIYMHGMPRGHKVDIMKQNTKCCFTVVETDHIVPEEYTTYFRSVMAFGNVRILEDETEKRDCLNRLVDKYSSAFKEGSMKEIDSKIKFVGIYVIDVDFISGKEAIEFAEAR